MKFLVVGSEGFIGRNLSEYLAHSGRNVMRADIVPKTSEGYVRLDATTSDFAMLVRRACPDVVVNCAGAASVPDSLTDPVRDFDLNTTCVIQLLEAVRQHAPAARVVNLSSAAVYGNPRVLPISTAAAPAPVSPYGFHKLMSELACQEYHAAFALKTVSLRIFSAFGEGLRKQLFWDLHNKLSQEGRPIELFGTGKESRDFIYIGDLVRAIVLVAERHNMDGSAINVASGREMLIEDAVGTFLKLYDPAPHFHFSGTVRTGDPLNWVADISDLKGLGFLTEWTLEQGLRAYHSWLIESGF